MRADESPRWILGRAVKAAAAGTFLAAGVHRAVRSWQRRRAGVRASSSILPPRDARLRRERARGDRVDDRVAQTMQRRIEDIAHAPRSCRSPTRAASSQSRRRPSAATRSSSRSTMATRTATTSRCRSSPAWESPPFFVATDYPARQPLPRTTASSRRSRSSPVAAPIPFGAAGLPGPVQSLLSACAEPAPAAALERLIARLAHDRLMAIANALEARTGLAERDLPDDTRALTWEELAELRAAGMDVGGTR